MLDKLVGFIFFGLMALMAGLFTLLPISWAYKMVASEPIYELSEGTMRATSAKLSYKGYIWKTTDGWIPIGVNSEGGISKWHFSVKDDDQTIIDCINNNEKVKLHYIDYVWMPYRHGKAHQVDSCEVIR